MKISFSYNAWVDYSEWQKSNIKIFDKINVLIKEVSRHPFSGSGKPEALKYELKGYWSRRISQEHRLVYKYSDNEITIVACRYHYTKK